MKLHGACSRMNRPYHMWFAHPLFCAALLVATVSSTSHAQTFDFSDGTQGWQIFNIHYFGDHVVDRSSTGGSPAWDTSTGLTAPSIRVTDLAGETWIGAPKSVYGNRSDLFGVAITFDIYYRTTDEATYASIGIENQTMALYIAEPPPPLNVWLKRSYDVVPGMWRVNSMSGSVATEAQIREVLSTLTGVYIHTEWRTGPDDTNVDNISIGEGCLFVSSQPSSISTCLSATVNFSVTVEGTGPFEYRWQWRPEGYPTWAEIVEGQNFDPATGGPAFDAADTTGAVVALTNSVGTSAASSGGKREIRVQITNSCRSVFSDTAIWTLCPTDFNCDNFVTGDDFDLFVADFILGSLTADFNGDGFVTGDDFDAFVEAFIPGC